MSTLLTKLNMAYRNNIRSVKIPINKFNTSFLTALQDGGLISSFSTDIEEPHFYNVFPLLTTDSMNSFVFKRISSGGKRRYVTKRFIFKNQSPFFVLLSTRGVLTPSDLLEPHSSIGGECFCLLETDLRRNK